MSSPHRDEPLPAPSIVLTGATSYLGVMLSRHLLEAGWRVTAVVRPSSPLQRFAEPEAEPETRVHDGTTRSLVDILDQSEPDAVIHLAALYRREHTVEDVEGLILSNVLFGTQLLEAMRLAGCRRLVTAASYFQHYDSVGYRPLNLYAATKQAFEDVVAYYVDAHGFEVVTLVLYDIYGPGDWRSKLMDAIRTAQLTGEPVGLPDEDVEMDLVYVDDAVQAIDQSIDLLTSGEVSRSERYAVSSGRRRKLSELISTFEEVAGIRVPHEWGRYETPSRSIVTPWRGPGVPGWEPRWSLREGVERFLAAE